ncbi:MAG: pyrimidine-nucleoside phosphorylase [Halanaerobium sp. 4-GBenrich]|jgi:pyrimidine-nucleoside phosphorylase|uniref:Pyrimidine-nucleoside phosphorylase n=1 Tax=Halanaerobium congolense TaxID=54121 RepID=A0A1G6I4G9_9FIRM|nr:pyrimidine-nucleoside phosphorylase [Halanaerobium congolense]ODS51003.1 MAG: pyrimidine-nucleoside phosphorylase [Halanaerobium sp. 4-GBenrich]TDP27118.1 thymidine phosphorylase [Halanaerobium congolense]TDX45343.1 thymidine phosphorylase [Halanaerobium congolense]SDC00626.1 thymidine phosphorylase [Halanaerobium congolense]SDK36453.1 thymidine phosphorylase [Halanaerobium congolense]
MRAYDIIYKKREGQKLTKDELEFLIKGYVEGDIPDYQMSAWAMAVYFQGMDAEETADLTMLMAESGDMIDLSPIKGIKVDKHSTGGVGDTTTLVLAPLAASAGIPVAKMSGRGLGHTGGTIDKLESIPNFNTSLSRDKFFDNVNQHGVSVMGQTGNLTPADKKLYALRDVTATVESIPLIASSIMSKKLAGGADAIVLDVKTGNGAFMKDFDSAKRLAEAMVAIGKNLGRNIAAYITDMNQPLGNAVGNALEVKEAIQTLKGQGPEDLTELCVELGAAMLQLAGEFEDLEKGKEVLRENLKNGKALAKFAEMIRAQGGNAEVVEDLSLLPTAADTVEVKAEKAGYISEIKALDVGLAAMILGAGRENKESKIDLAVGLELKKKKADRVEVGDALALLHYNESKNLEEAKAKLLSAFTITEAKTKKNKLLYEIIK